MKTFRIKRYLFGTRRKLLLVFLFVEVILLGSVAYTYRQSIPPDSGFLVKNGDRYVIAWIESSKEYLYMDFGNLSEALNFAKNVLNLEANGRNFGRHSMEYIEIKDRFGAFVLVWKTAEIDFLNQLTFYSQNDAHYFLSAFKKGSYSTSPFGHSVILRPISPQI